MSHQLMQLQSPKRQSQADRILALLENPGNVFLVGLARTDGWVSLPMIMRLGIACHTRRIHELRKRGHIIECRKEWVDGSWHTAYRLIKSS